MNNDTHGVISIKIPWTDEGIIRLLTAIWSAMPSNTSTVSPPKDSPELPAQVGPATPS